MGEISKMLLNGGGGGGGLAGSMQMDRRFMVMKKIVLRGLSAPVPGLYTCI